MNSTECGIVSGQAWSGGLTLSVTSANADVPADLNGLRNDSKSGSNMSESAMTASSLSSQSAGALRRGRASPAPVNRVPLVRQSEERRARRCRFYRNGDRWFPGALLAVSSDRHRTWDSLLEDVTRLLEHPLHLAAGVRFVFTLDGNKIEVLDQLIDMGEYVASSTDAFKTIDYRAARLPQWRLHTRRREALHVPSSTHNHGSATTPEPNPDSFSIRPRLVTVLRNGQRPRKAVRVLLNRRTARALDQVMEDLSVSLKLDSGAVRKIYTLDGRQIVSLKELFLDDDVFIACGLERCSRDDFYLDSEETRSIQPLLKGHCPPGLRRCMPSPKPRGRAISPLPLLDQSGSLPRTTRRSRESPNSSRHPSLSPHISFPSTEDLFLPATITARYRVGRVLGDGNFAVVRECQQLATKRKLALKIIDKSKCEGKEDMIQSEVDILRMLRHENIVLLEEEVDCPDYLYLVMELVTGGDLFDAIAAATRYTEEEAGHLVRDLAAALEYVHERNVVHRDVKPENLLVVPGSMPRLKLGDFGLAVQLTEPLYTICGTPTYVAPEILAERGYGVEVDIWAAGVITYILLCGFPPFISATNNQEELFEQILAGHLTFPSPYWDHVSHQPRHLIAAMVAVEPSERYTATQVLRHPWIQGQSSDEYTHEGYGEADYMYDSYNQVNTADYHYQHGHQQEHLSSSVFDLRVPPPSTPPDGCSTDDGEYHWQPQPDHQEEECYDYQHNSITSPAAKETQSLMSGDASARLGVTCEGSSGDPVNITKNQSHNHSNDSAVSSSSGIESYTSSSNDNNRYQGNKKDVGFVYMGNGDRVSSDGQYSSAVVTDHQSVKAAAAAAKNNGNNATGNCNAKKGSMSPTNVLTRVAGATAASRAKSSKSPSKRTSAVGSSGTTGVDKSRRNNAL